MTRRKARKKIPEDARHDAEPQTVREAVQSRGDPEARYVICVGASAGGLEPLQQFFAAIPDDTGASFVLILHLSPDFKSMMPELLAKYTKMKISTVEHDAELEPDAIHIIPPRKNMVLSGRNLLLSEQDRTPGHAVNSPIDVFLKSLAQEAGPHGVGVILSGTGSDGSRGIESLKDAGGFVLVQEPKSAKFDGMPISALNTRTADRCADPTKLAEIVAELVSRSLPCIDAEPATDSIENQVVSILESLRYVTSTDFSYCRESMLMRRVRRRMALIGIGTIFDYIERLNKDPDEVRALRNDLLIGVTAFFRDGEPFEALRKHLAAMLTARATSESFRVWVPACATGEEVYSLAMIISEAMEASGRHLQVKIFATDLDQEALAKASNATYGPSDVESISSARLARYFSHSDGRFTVNQNLRDMVIFARQDLVADPPFTKIDVVSCRNFLIYVEQPAQEQVLAKLHFALRVNGLLFLGSGESLGRLEHEFETLDLRAKVFAKTRDINLHAMRSHMGCNQFAAVPPPAPRRVPPSREAANRALLETIAEMDDRTVALLDAEASLLDVVEDRLGIFTVPKGNPTTDVMKLVQSEISTAIATGLHRLRSGESMVQYGIETDGPGGPRRLVVRLRLLTDPETRLSRVLFVVDRSDMSEVRSTAAVDESSSEQMRQLQTELLQTRESLQATIEELQTSNEEQQSTNEELVASNEEMQSTNEELLSVNEELSTVNLEYQKSNKELAVLAADLDNLLTHIEVGTLFLDNDLRIRKYTPAVCSIVKLVEHDVGRSIEHFADRLGPDLLGMLRESVETGVSSDQEHRAADGRWYLMRVLPYVEKSGERSGVLLTFLNVTAVKNAEETMRMMNDGLAVANRHLSEQREELEDLFSIVAHDLKRPVVSLDGLLKLVSTADGKDEQGDLMGKAIDEVSRMRRMLVDLGQMSALTRRKLIFEPVDIEPWLDDVVNQHRSRAVARGVRLGSTADARQVRLPRSAMEEVVNNLVENALNYGCTAENPRIDVTCEVMEGTIRLVVRDNGQGIAPEHHQKIFEPFRRLEPESIEGSGIGLVAVRRVLARIGGTIALESAIGQGAKFIVRIPVEAARQPDDPETRVLVVEDDSMDAKVVQRHLGRGYTCVVARTLADAIRQVEQQSFDLILLDLSLTDGHGFRLLTRLRELHLDTPVVVLSGHAEGIAEDTLLSTVAGFIDKAELDEIVLREKVDEALAASV